MPTALLPCTVQPELLLLLPACLHLQVPPAMKEDPAYLQPCFRAQCNLSTEDPTQPCPKTDTERNKA